MVSHEKKLIWDILENDVPTCVLPNYTKNLFKGFYNYANL